jgi:hypothetical protein
MRKRPYAKMVREGKYVAEVDIELIDMDEGWSPYLSLDDAKKLDEVRQVNWGQVYLVGIIINNVV